MAYIKDVRPETMMVDGNWAVGYYQYKAHRQLEEFVTALKDKRILGSLCPGCGKVIVPPRNICGRCHLRMDKRLIVSDRGTITCFVYTPPVVKGKYILFGLEAVQQGVLKEGEILIPCFARFDGSDSNVATLLLNADVNKVHIGMRVKAVWAKELKGQLGDLEGVEPLENQE